MPSNNRITFLGTGLMGFPMARNLTQAGEKVCVWNRSADKAAGLANHGANVAKSVPEAVADADIVISMVTDGATLHGLIDMALGAEALKAGAVWVDMSSTKPQEARTASATLAEAGVAFLDAPVSGGTKGADAATLAIMAGGDGAAFDRVSPVLSAMGRPVLVGPNGAGQLAKLANQAIVAVTIGAVAEAMLLLERGGADPAAVRTALKGGFADSTILQQHGARMTERDFEPGGLSRLQLKDLDNVLGEASGAGLSLPMVQDVRDRFSHYINEMDGGERDHSGLFEELLARNDLLNT